MWAMIVKEFRQLRRDRRTLAMMIVLPVVLLVVFEEMQGFLPLTGPGQFKPFSLSRPAELDEG